jgi:hypothetical protein
MTKIDAAREKVSTVEKEMRADADLMRQISDSREAVRAGKVVPWDQVKREMDEK